MDQITKRITVLLLFASIAGIAISSLLMKEDVLSTANTLTVYFPEKFGVTPAMTESGGIFLGIFISLTQIISAAIAFSSNFKIVPRITAGILFIAAVPFDAWTDIVFRSGYLQGDLRVASITTVAFYTFGSEIMQGLSWAVLMFIWRQAIADIMWSVAYMFKSLSTLPGEWEKFFTAAGNVAARESNSRVSNRQYGSAVDSKPSSKAVGSSVVKTSDISSSRIADIRHSSTPSRGVPEHKTWPPRPAPKPASRGLSGMSEPTYHSLADNAGDFEQDEMFSM